MKLAFKVFGYCALAFSVIVTVSCDTFKEDQPSRQVIFDQIEFYTQPGVAVLIDMTAIIKKSFSAGSLEILVDPSKGKLLNIDTFLLSYVPDLQFYEGKDEFTLALVENGDVISQQIITVSMKDVKELPCGLYAIEDRVRWLPGASISINFLKNDIFCDTERSALGVSIHSNPRFGEARVVGDTAIVYTPAAGFSGDDQLVYEITAPDGRNCFGMVTITDDWSVSLLKLPGKYFSNIFFVSELVGYVAGNSGFFKTTDGGRNWKEVITPKRNPAAPGSNQMYYGEIFFVDSDHGFTAFRDVFFGPDTFESNFGNGGILSTEDGGERWDIKLGVMSIASIYFTSPATGFFADISETDDNGLTTLTIFKTTDGGQNWKVVLTSETVLGVPTSGPIRIQFSDPTNGYVSHDNKLHITNNGGETWTLSEAGRLIRCVTATSDNVLFMSYWDEAAIYRSEGGLRPLTPTRFPYLVRDIRFSPSGKVGFSVGISGSPEAGGRHPTWIGMSNDRGLTWLAPTPVGLFLDSIFLDIAAPSDYCAYILTNDGLIKYSNH